MSSGSASRRVALIAIGVIALGSIGAVSALAGKQSDRTMRPSPRAVMSTRPTISSLDRPLRAGDALPVDVALRLNAFAQSAGNNAIDWGQARQISQGVWLVAADTDICLHITVPDDVTSCGTMTGLTEGAGPVITGQRAGSDPFTLGVVADGISSVTVHLADGSVRSAPVVNNSFKLAAKSPADSLSVDGPGGRFSEALTSGEIG